MSIKRLLKPVLLPIYSTLRPRIIRYAEIGRYGLRLRSSSAGNHSIARIVRSGIPASVGKIGSAELLALTGYLKGKNAVADDVWEQALRDLYVCAGVHPHSEESLCVFSKEYTEALKKMSVLGVWYNSGEAAVARRYCKDAIFSHFWCLEPYYHEKPWSSELEGKTVLVMHPFVDTIAKQYAKRELIWSNRQNVLPEFDLRLIRVPLHDSVVTSPYESWKVALDDLKRQMSEINFDVVLIGAGAYSLPLCAHAKSLGKIGIHMGGSTQILFGVMGKRWLNHRIISGFFNEHWCHPSAQETPGARTLVEGGCYW